MDPPNILSFGVTSLYMGSSLSRIQAIINDRVFPRFPRPAAYWNGPLYVPFGTLYVIYCDTEIAVAQWLEHWPLMFEVLG